jgi:tRNA-Thr(GGU) m(6)t(6)A37 methyltransferase TsaA
MKSYSFEPIGVIRSCFKEKFGTPRQPGLVPEAAAQVEILPAFRQKEAFRCLEGFSHIWILFVFHQCAARQWKPTVRPPRLGGNRRVGVFASRSGFRPNPIGQSVVELASVELQKEAVRLHLKGIDLIDGTPILDIKPYLAYADSVPHARSGYAQRAPMSSKSIFFSATAAHACRQFEKGRYPHLEALVANLLAMDPRPGYKARDDHRSYGLSLWDLNILFNVEKDRIVVESITVRPEGQ